MRKTGSRSTGGNTGATPESSAGGQRAGAATRRSGAELENAILDAAWEVLVEHGYSGFTYKAIAARAGTSRPVLYRRWPQREDMLLATLARQWQPIDVPDTGSLRDDAIGFLRNASTDRTQTVLLMTIQLGDYFRDTGTSPSELREALGGSDLPAPFAQIVDRAVARGELTDEHRPARLVNLPFDLLRHDMLMTLRPVPDEAVTEIVDQVWLPQLKPPGLR